eukprot:7923963-Lingulodinium_polyedra.AAC.1
MQNTWSAEDDFAVAPATPVPANNWEISPSVSEEETLATAWSPEQAPARQGRGRGRGRGRP